MAQAAIERKIYFCCGSLNHSEGKVKSGMKLPQARKPKLMPVKVLVCIIIYCKALRLLRGTGILAIGVTSQIFIHKGCRILLFSNYLFYYYFFISSIL